MSPHSQYRPGKGPAWTEVYMGWVYSASWFYMVSVRTQPAVSNKMADGNILDYFTLMISTTAKTHTHTHTHTNFYNTNIQYWSSNNANTGKDGKKTNAQFQISQNFSDSSHTSISWPREASEALTGMLGSQKSGLEFHLSTDLGISYINPVSLPLTWDQCWAKNKIISDRVWVGYVFLLFLLEGGVFLLLKVTYLFFKTNTFSFSLKMRMQLKRKLPK